MAPKPVSRGREKEQPKYGGIQAKPDEHLCLGHGGSGRQQVHDCAIQDHESTQDREYEQDYARPIPAHIDL